MNRTLIEDIQEADDFPRPSTSLGENATLLHDFEDANSTTSGHPFEVPDIARFIDRNPWVVYVIIGILTLCVIAITVLLLRNVCKNKKRVIQQDDDPVLSSTYDGGSNQCYNILCCQGDHDESTRVRQNSESNLDPYRRPPLPPIGMKQDDFHYISPFSSNELSEPENISAANIHAIRGIAHLPQRAEQYRQLPQLKL